jgi:peroxiredoxin Q/BCP
MMGKTAMQIRTLWLAMLLAGLLALPGAASALKVGQKAPDFKLPSTTGKPISLSQYRGKAMVLVEFYHADFGPT